jgi:hypothetical protein
MYFESEQAARGGESTMEGPPPEVADLMSDVTYLDLSDPWFV